MRFHNITKDDMLNGDGLRVVLWVSGCEHGCKECHNPITWDSQSGILFDQVAKQEIFNELEKSYVSGITFSGGDPLHPANSFEIGEFAKEIKEKYPNKTIWLYTGYTWETICQQDRMKYIDVLVDGEFKIDLFDARLLWKGSSNQRVIDVQKTLKSNSLMTPVIYCENYQ